MEPHKESGITVRPNLTVIAVGSYICCSLENMSLIAGYLGYAGIVGEFKSHSECEYLVKVKLICVKNLCLSRDCESTVFKYSSTTLCIGPAVFISQHILNVKVFQG